MKIIHISDLHFGMHNQQILAVFLQEVNLLKPDIIIISGDLTQRAKIYQFEALQAFINQLSSIVLIVPGNHDIPFHNFFARLLSPFQNYHSYVGNNKLPAFENDRLRILGVNSVNPYQIKDGKLSHKTLALIAHHFNSEDKKLNILFFHHNFDYLEGLHKPLQNDQEFLTYLKKSSINIVCTGHLHYAHLGLIKKENDHSCLVLHAGSLMCQRSKDQLNSYFLIENDQHVCTINWRVFCQDQFNTRSIHHIDFSKKNALLESLTQSSKTI